MIKLENSYTIRDPVHGDVQVSDTEMRIIGHPMFQRLRRVRQLATAYLVYPGALHTRFEHSIGTMHMTGLLASNSIKDEDSVSQLRLAALLHDVGHSAFSHEGEQASGSGHEQRGRELIRNSEIADIVSENHSLSTVLGYFSGKGLGALITSAIGSDRIDYLLRDAYYTGVAYGIIDKGRVKEAFEFIGSRLAVRESELVIVESILIARFMMFMNVYNHKTVRICAAMLKQMLSDSIADGIISPQDICLLGDDDIIFTLKGRNGFADSLLNRRLWKKIHEVRLEEFPKKGFSKPVSVKKIGELTAWLREVTGQRIIIDIPRVSYKEPELDVISENGKATLEKYSPILSALRSAEHSRLKVMFLAEKPSSSTASAVRSAVSRWLNEN